MDPDRQLLPSQLDGANCQPCISGPQLALSNYYVLKVVSMCRGGSRKILLKGLFKV